MSKIESKIKSAEEWVDEFMASFSYGVELSGKEIDELINTFKAARRGGLCKL